MKFARRGARSFVSEDREFKIVRPSGTRVRRDALALKRAGHDYNVRQDGTQIWLLDGEREVGYAAGSVAEWRLMFGEAEFGLLQPKVGAPHTALMEGDERVGEISGRGFPLRALELTIRAELTTEQQAFIAMVVLLGWREGDRAMFGQIQTGDSYPAGS